MLSESEASGRRDGLDGLPDAERERSM